uniref:Uncharacterized protein n=1 Tax=Pipistrellus kuhlii TaxID=59472 RepID=A0A7J7WD81_PIPKU|nr:hypothetical protein mPipKuh1_008067 [Pipistrellus kuhlii]
MTISVFHLKAVHPWSVSLTPFLKAQASPPDPSQVPCFCNLSSFLCNTGPNMIIIKFFTCHKALTQRWAVSPSGMYFSLETCLFPSRFVQLIFSVLFFNAMFFCFLMQSERGGEVEKFSKFVALNSDVGGKRNILFPLESSLKA